MEKLAQETVYISLHYMWELELCMGSIRAYGSIQCLNPSEEQLSVLNKTSSVEDGSV